MSTLIALGEEQRRQPLLHSTPTNRYEEEIVISSSSNEPDALKLTLIDSNKRLLSLDVFRGLTVALMILVDDAGGAFPSINHAPWFGVTIADFVMPFFLFSVGISISLVFKKASSKSLATKKVILRTVKLFLLGLFLQGGYFHGRNNLAYGVDVVEIRWLGVLQRISIGYLLASITEIWLVKNVMVDSSTAFVRKYYVQWIFTTLLLSFYMCLLYGLYVPNWEFQAPSQTLSTNGSHTQIVHCGVRGSLEPPCNAVGYIDRYFLGEQHLYLRPVYRRTKECSVNSPDYGPLPPHSPEWCLAPFDPEGILRIFTTLLLSFYMCLLYGLYVPNWEFQAPSQTLSTNGSHTQIVHCGVRGSLEPPCNAVGYIDRYFLGEQHLYLRPVYRRTKECSVNSPDYGPLPPHSPEWCLAPFDPEGILSSIMAVLTCFVGLHFGHILLHYKGQMHRVLLWSMSSFPLLISGFGLEVLGIPFSKPLYTLSYMCITAGASGLFLTIIFYIVDVKHFRKPVVLLEWMGMNALIIYALAACDIFPAAVQGFYWRSPENNLVDGMESLLQTMLHSSKWGTLVFVLLEILFWCLVGGFLHMKGIYIKL